MYLPCYLLGLIPLLKSVGLGFRVDIGIAKRLNPPKGQLWSFRSIKKAGRGGFVLS
jgi:hypothetical protein